jgi:hypothetical protein
LLPGAFSSCYVSKKLDSPATIKINSDFTITVNTCNEPKYVSTASSNDYKNHFLDALKSELKENNLTTKDSGNADYELTVTQLKVIEDMSSQSVSDDSSSMNGERFDVHGCGINFYGILYKNGNKVDELKADASKDEELTNRRTFFEWLFGVNKDHTSYHVKEMSSGICERLTEKCGKRTCAVITKKIVKEK